MCKFVSFVIFELFTKKLETFVESLAGVWVGKGSKSSAANVGKKNMVAKSVFNIS